MTFSHVGQKRLFLGSEGLQSSLQTDQKDTKFQAVDDQCQISGTYQCSEKAGAQAGWGNNEKFQGPGRN